MQNRDHSQWKEGDSLPPLTKGPITREDLKKYADASGDTNPIHLDEAFAKAAGFPSVIVHGMLAMAYLADYVRYVFPEDRFEVTRIAGRFRKVLFPGDELVTGGQVKKVESNQILTISLWAKNQKGELTTDGEVDVRLR